MWHRLYKCSFFVFLRVSRNFSNRRIYVINILNVDNFEYLNSTSKKKIQVASFLKIGKYGNSIGRYLCRIRTRKLSDFSNNIYNRIIPG